MERAARVDYLLGRGAAGDPDRYLCALFAPEPRREPLLALVLLHRELARVPARVTNPMAGLIRYQWWRDAVAEAAAGRPASSQSSKGWRLGSGPAGSGRTASRPWSTPTRRHSRRAAAG